MDIKQWIVLTLIGLETASAISRRVGKWDCPNHPVCGTDGVTYNNECEFRLGIMENEDLQIMFEGPCKTYKMMNVIKMAGNKHSKMRQQRTQILIIIMIDCLGTALLLVIVPDCPEFVPDVFRVYVPLIEYLGYYPEDGDGRHVADSAAVFRPGTLHGIADQNAAASAENMSMNAKNSHNNFKWIWDGQALGWSSILKNKFK